jgi:nucleotide-binding universal stress UspA family protein
MESAKTEETKLMYKNILIPVVFDNEEKTQAAIDAARVMANEGAALTLLHVIETVPNYVAEYIPADFAQSTREALSKKLIALADKVPGGQAAIGEGHAGARISRWAKENNTDCIVIASHQPALSDILLGSVAHHVVRHAPCAVHVLR